MRRRSDRQWKAAVNRHSTLKTQQFCRDLALIVIHGYDRVEPPIACCDENRIRGEWTLCRDPFQFRLFNRWTDGSDLFRPHQSSLAGMRI